MKYKVIAALCGMLLVVTSTSAAQKKKQPSNPMESEKISSAYNYQYSVTRPSQEKLIELISKNRGKIDNRTIEEAYKNPSASPMHGLIYAMAMDYTLGDGSDAVLQAYLSAAYAGTDFFGHRGYIEYADFLLRSRRYDALIEHFDPDVCFQYKAQCSYYITAAKFLRDGDCDVPYIKDAKKFKPMLGILSYMCPNKPSNPSQLNPR